MPTAEDVQSDIFFDRNLPRCLIPRFDGEIRHCCTNSIEDSLSESSVVGVLHEQTEALDAPHHELA